MLSKIDLISMGYRILGDFDSQIYAKPVGYTLFVVNLNDNKIANYFQSYSTNELIPNDSKIIENICDLQDFEQTTILHGRFSDTKLYFLTLEQEAEELCTKN